MEYFTHGKNSIDQELTGRVTWCRASSLNKFQKWSLNLYPDAASLQILRELKKEGIRNEMKMDDDGFFFQISRPSKIKLKPNVETLVTPPVVTHADGRDMTDVLIGD